MLVTVRRFIHASALPRGMAEYHVVPSGNQWRVQKQGGLVISNHRKKQPAVNQAKQEATAGDSIVIHRANGTVQERRNY